MRSKNEIDDTKKIANSVIKESMVVHAAPLKFFSKRKETKIERKRDGHVKAVLEKQLIQLPECKQLEQELILKSAREKKIQLDIDEVAQTNHVTVEMASSFHHQRSFMIKGKI
ncbi:retrotransposon gag protein [Cucumis melo var. makuwa]|uniref:Retrotransposon gag protein n=1 Tax=Cucumis melo var. makuwa TaxID=1194695 RepID=A0A5A7VE11_CUCMM|nr:retrotransposon gag protein [Cucumis melo var. makuwa]TYK00920.1 retrotransposon gag protein [Cucumis melo var. makuwa]